VDFGNRAAPFLMLLLMVLNADDDGDVHLCGVWCLF
jgi:hypothetical protein